MTTRTGEKQMESWGVGLLQDFWTAGNFSLHYSTTPVQQECIKDPLEPVEKP
jgi:hypothetical protein